MAKRLLYCLLLAFTTTSLFAQDSPVGRWETHDDETGEVKSIIKIYEQNGKFYGRIDEILTDNKDAVCTECSGKQKNAPILGMVIIKDLERDGDEWNGGTIFDPQKGAEYRLVAWFEDNPDEIFIRGKHWTGLFRTQTWTRRR